MRSLAFEQVNPMASVLGAQQFLSMGWPGQQAAATGWGGGVPGWGNAGGMAMMGWPAAAVPPAAPQQPGFGGNPNLGQPTTPPPAQLFGGGMPGGFQPGLGHSMPHQAQAPFMQPPNGMLVTAAQFQPGYAGLQHIPGVDASSMGAAIAQPPFQVQQAQHAQQARAAQGLAVAQGAVAATAGDPTAAVDPAGGLGTVAGAIMQANRGSAEPLRAKAEELTGEAKPAGGSHRRGRSRPGSTANTGSGDGVVPQSPGSGGGGAGAQKAPPTRAASRRQRSRLSAASAGEVNDAGADSRSPQETLKLSQAGVRTQVWHPWHAKDTVPQFECIPDPEVAIPARFARRTQPAFVQRIPVCASAVSNATACQIQIPASRRRAAPRQDRSRRSGRRSGSGGRPLPRLRPTRRRPRRCRCRPCRWVAASPYNSLHGPISS